MQEIPLDRCYRLLELEPGASLAEVREAYRLQSRVWHPDRFAGNASLQARATSRQQELNEAYRRLVEVCTQFAGPPASDAAPSNAPAPPTPAQPAATRTRSQVRQPGRRALIAAGFALLLIATGVLLVMTAADDRVLLEGTVLNADAIASGADLSCAAVGSRVLCWRPQRSGRAAEASRHDARPVRLTMPHDVTALAVGLLHACALLADRSVHCWGSNFAGQLGTGGLSDRVEAAAVALPGVAFAEVSSSGRHTCGLADVGTLYCWGDDTDGQLGLGRPVAQCQAGRHRFMCSDVPEQVGSPRRWAAVSAGGGHTCAIDVDGMLHCWGSNRFGQLGTPSADSCAGPGGSAPCQRRPARVDLPAGRAMAVAAGASHTCALDDSGRAFCWGLNRQQQTGTGAADRIAEPAAVQTALRFSALLAGGYHTCGITAAGALYCWGSDALGELRGRGRDDCDGSACADLPVRLATRTEESAAGFGITCARGRAGDVRCWGAGALAGETAAAGPSPGGDPTWADRLRMRRSAIRSEIREFLRPLLQAL